MGQVRNLMGHVRNFMTEVGNPLGQVRSTMPMGQDRMEPLFDIQLFKTVIYK